MLDLPYAPVPGRVHLVGIGGVGMAGIARILIQSGCEVSGSDTASHRLTDSLKSQGARLFQGHAREHLPDQVDWAVRTPAVSESNPEVDLLRERGIPVYSRGQVLAALSNPRHTIAVAGAHGKTTTSAMTAWIFDQCSKGFGYVIGGETALRGVIADLGGVGDPFVIEADESDGTIVGYSPETAVLTHVEWDHPERFPTETSLWACYRKFSEQSQTVWLREDDAQAFEICRNHPKIRCVGRSSRCDVQLLEQQDHPEGQDMTLCMGSTVYSGSLRLPGLHNTWNALMAIGVTGQYGVSVEHAVEALRTFPSVGRRFQRREVSGGTLLQDYAHHPTEIRAVIRSLSALNPKRMRVVFQPHRYSRTQQYVEAFADSFASLTSLDLLPVYAASERPEQGVDSDVLGDICQRKGVDTRVWQNQADLIDDLEAWMVQGGLIALLGAGDITRLYDLILPTGSSIPQAE